MTLDVVLQRLGGNFGTDLVAVLEAVCHGLGRRVDPDRNAVDHVRLDALGQRRAREVDDADRKRRIARMPGVIVQCNPYLGRRLRRQAVEAKRAEQTDRRPGNSLGHFGEAALRRDVSIRNGIQPTRYAHQRTARRKPASVFDRNAERLEIARPRDPQTPDGFDCSGFGALHGYVLNTRYL